VSLNYQRSTHSVIFKSFKEMYVLDVNDAPHCHEKVILIIDVLLKMKYIKMRQTPEPFVGSRNKKPL